MDAAVSIVMVSYHTGPVLFEAIDDSLAQPELHELIVVDNGNPEPVLAEIGRRAEADPRLILISGHGNIGFAAGCNRGARRATGTYLFLLNPDCRLPQDALRALLAESTRLSRPWLLGGRLLNSDGSEQRGARREMLTPRSALAEVCCLDRLMPNRFTRVNLNETPVPDRTVAVPVISGACMMLPVEDYWRVGGMDEGYFLHVEDIDFCLRFRAAGGTIAFVPQVSILHYKGTSRASPLMVEWHKTRGFIRYFRKNFGSCHRLSRAVANVGVLARFAFFAARVLACRIIEPQRRKPTKN